VYIIASAAVLFQIVPSIEKKVLKVLSSRLFIDAINVIKRGRKKCDFFRNSAHDPIDDIVCEEALCAKALFTVSKCTQTLFKLTV
jgi:hypothetical protein